MANSDRVFGLPARHSLSTAAMAIRITTISEPSETVVKIDGRLTCKDIDVVLQTVQGLRGPAVLDLTDLQSIDRSATALLRDIIALGVHLRAASPYVKLLLEPELGRRRRTDHDPA